MSGRATLVFSPDLSGQVNAADFEVGAINGHQLEIVIERLASGLLERQLLGKDLDGRLALQAVRMLP